MNKTNYLGLSIAGLIFPYTQLILFILENGINLQLIFEQIIRYRISTFAWLDVVITAVVVILFTSEDKEKVSNWWVIVATTLFIGPSCGLPLYLYTRK